MRFKLKIFAFFLFLFFVFSATRVYAQFPQDQFKKIISSTPLGLALTTVYDVYCGINVFTQDGTCPTENNTWIGNAIINNLILNQLVWIPICDQTIDVVLEGGNCISPESNTGSPANDTSMTTPYTGSSNLSPGAKQIVRPHGGLGLAKIATDSLAYMTDPKTAPIPTNLALFMNDTFGDTMFGTTAYAGSPFVGVFENLNFGLWKVSRNISISIFGLLLAVVGVMVMARSKISPQVVITVYTVLPIVPVSLAFIFLSYPAIASMYSFVGTFMNVAWSFMNTTILETLFTSAGNNLPLVSGDSFWDVAIAAVNGIVTLPSRLLVGGSTVFFLVTFGLIGTVIVLGALTFTFAKVFVSMMYTAIVSPFVGLLSILPGKQGLLMNLVKRVIADVLALPIMLVVAGVGMTIMAYVPDSGSINNFFSPLFINTFGLGFGLVAVVIKAFIGLSIMWKARKARSMVESLLGGVDDLFGASGGAQGAQKRR